MGNLLGENPSDISIQVEGITCQVKGSQRLSFQPVWVMKSYEAAVCLCVGSTIYSEFARRQVEQYTNQNVLMQRQSLFKSDLSTTWIVSALSSK